MITFDNLKKYKYISFDIFYIFILRNVIKPTDVFDIVEKVYNSNAKNKISNFKSRRISAQIEASKESNEEETTIKDIYKKLAEDKYYGPTISKKLYNIELETELNICIPNYKIVEIYNKCIKNNINVIITSDMYLDFDFITKLLNKCNIKDYKKLYLSSKFQKRKSTGSMFSYILKDLNIKNNEIVHIGDNLVSDYLIPKSKKIKAFRIVNKMNNKYYYKNDKSYEYKTLENFISNHYDYSKSYYYNMGYETFGPILYGFSKWLNENVDSEKIFFLSRDGYLILKAFNIVSNNSNKSSYFYASRRALIVPTLWLDQDLKSMLDKFYIRDSIKISNLFRKFGLEAKDYESIVIKNGYKLTDCIKYENLFDEAFLIMFEQIKPIIHKNSKKEFQLLRRYIEQEKLDGDISIVDIGWNGNMQMALKNIMDKLNKNSNIKGYYVGILPESNNLGKINMKGFLFDEKNNQEIYICLKVINSIFESMFLAPHGSVKTYKESKNKIEPILLDYEYEEGIEKNSYFEIQEGALKFMQDFNDS